MAYHTKQQLHAQIHGAQEREGEQHLIVPGGDRVSREWRMATRGTRGWKEGEDTVLMRAEVLPDHMGPVKTRRKRAMSPSPIE